MGLRSCNIKGKSGSQMNRIYDLNREFRLEGIPLKKVTCQVLAPH